MLSAGSLGTLKTEIVRTFAALNATNEAILYAKSPEELYRKVSEAAYFSGDFLASAIFLLEPGTTCCVSPPAAATTSPACAASTFRSWPVHPKVPGFAARPFATSRYRQQRFPQRPAFDGLA